MVDANVINYYRIWRCIPVGILGGVGAVFDNKIFGFADTNIKNRELRKQNEEILQQNNNIYKKLIALEDKLAAFNQENKY